MPFLALAAQEYHVNHGTPWAANAKNGTCYTTSECEARSGTNGGSCAAGYGVCCQCKAVDFYKCIVSWISWSPFSISVTAGCGGTYSENWGVLIQCRQDAVLEFSGHFIFLKRKPTCHFLISYESFPKNLQYWTHLKVESHCCCSTYFESNSPTAGSCSASFCSINSNICQVYFLMLSLAFLNE